MQKLWQVKPRKYPNLPEQLLANRGINPEDKEQVQKFLDPQYGDLNSPFLFEDMAKAVDRIWQALDAKEKILIYSDYDADAITANAVLFRALKFLGADISTYIPDRFSEGYGLNVEAFEKIAEAGATLVITVDCGTNSVEEAQFCKENGIDLIITDHHELTGELPYAFALINPKLPGTKYPYRELTGVGVSFKLACAVLSRKEKHNLPDGFEKWFLDLVAIGTVADCHSLMGENRTLVKYGLQVMKKTKWPGLKILMQLAGLDGELSTFSIGFVIAPRINAAGRIEHASAAFDLLVSDEPVEALQLAQRLDDLNKRRQMLTETVMSEAREQLISLQTRKILLAVGENWPKGVVGLVAGKLMEEFSRPVLVLERGEVQATGSARSIPSFNIVEALNFSKNYLVKYGGHAAAAGFTLKNEDIDVFYKNLLDFAERNLSDNDLVKILDVEAELQPDDVSLENLKLLEKFEPFGMDNVKPKFLMKSLVLQNVNAVGQMQQHVQMSFSAAGKYFKAIAFNFGKFLPQLAPGKNLDVVFELLADNWNGSTTVKLRIIDFKANA